METIIESRKSRRCCRYVPLNSIRKTPRTRRFIIIIIIIFLIILTIALYNVIFTVNDRPRKEHSAYKVGGPLFCYRSMSDTLPKISQETPPKERSIFFHETSCRSHRDGKIVLNARQACAVESAAKTNPNFQVYLLFTSPGTVKDQRTESYQFIKALLSYENVKLLHINFEQYCEDSPVQSLYESGKVERSRYPYSHSSDILRYLTLWKYGGIYLDLDVVLIKSLDDLPDNCAAIESDSHVAAGILRFQSTGIGHYWVEQCLYDLKESFSGTLWGNNGPGVITRLLQKLCDEKSPGNMTKKSCQGFTVLPRESFYPVPWPEWNKYFEERYNDEVLNNLNATYAIHLWNKLSETKKLNINDNVSYNILAKKYCPNVFAECIDYF